MAGAIDGTSLIHSTCLSQQLHEIEQIIVDPTSQQLILRNGTALPYHMRIMYRAGPINLYHVGNPDSFKQFLNGFMFSEINSIPFLS